MGTTGPDPQGVPTDGQPTTGVYAQGYFETRLQQDPNRAKVWAHVVDYLRTWIRPDARVLELGAGWCDFANAVEAGSVVAMDLDATVERAAGPQVRAIVGDCTDLDRFEDASFDVVFASNLLEHLHRPESDRLLAGAARVLSPGGRLILLQPNFRLQPGRYFDDYTHVSIFTDQSLADYVTASGFRVETVPIKPLAGQMLLVATPRKA